MAYDIGQQEAILLTLVDENDVAVTGEVLTGYARDRDGNSYPLTSTNPSANLYRIELPVFDRPGRWWVWWAGTTPNTGGKRTFDVDWSPAAPATSPYDVEDGGVL